MPKNMPTKTSRGLLGIEDDRIVPVIRNLSQTNEESDAVFIFQAAVLKDYFLK